MTSVEWWFNVLARTDITATRKVQIIWGGGSSGVVWGEEMITS